MPVGHWLILALLILLLAEVSYTPGQAEQA
jgi:hypothetical protein